MKILLLSRGDFDYDGRLRELFQVFSRLGDLYAFTLGSTPQAERHTVYSGPAFNRSYPDFIKTAVAYGRSVGPVDLLVLDNGPAALPGLLLRRRLRPRAMIQDCRELYLPKDCTSVKSRILCELEQAALRRADIVICANRERAEIMERISRLKHPPLVYENLRRLQYSSDSAPAEQAARFSGYLHDGELRIFSTNGWSLARGTGDLIRALPRVRRNCRLFLAGGGREADRQALEEIIAEEGLDNVELLGNQNQDALKYLAGVCHIGIVSYGQAVLNQRYCASGKLYEFIYEGLPVVTTTNPPLKNLCDGEQIGVADDLYYNGINAVAENYDFYRKNAAAFGLRHTVEENNANLLRDLAERLDSLTEHRGAD